MGWREPVRDDSVLAIVPVSRIMIWSVVLALMIQTPPSTADRPFVAIVVGAEGTPDYGAEFRAAADLWKSAAKRGGADSVVIGTDRGAKDSPPDRDRIQAILAEHATEGAEPLWLILIGHGTDDGKEAKFNLRGPDLSDRELARWLEPVKRPVVVAVCASASARFLNGLSGPNRVIVTATRSGSEVNFSRFGPFLAEAISDKDADLDKDSQVSLLEAYLAASHRVAEYYKTRSQLATEHALIDDNGDRLGTSPDRFRGARVVPRAGERARLDGLRAHQLHLIPSDSESKIPAKQRQRRDAIEAELAALRTRKSAMPPDAYYQEVERLMVELGGIYLRDTPGEPAH